MMTQLCNFEGAQFLFFGPNASPIILYSHLPILIISFLLAFFVLRKDTKALGNRVLATMLTIFGLWVLCDSVFWASNNSALIMFVWATIILIEPLVYICTAYLLHVLVIGRDISFKAKVLVASLYAPLIILAPTSYILSSFDLGTCLANETIWSYLTYVIEIIMVCSIAVFAVRQYKKTTGKIKKEVVYLSIGMLLFLLAFSWGNIVGSFSDNWVLGQYGLFGMPVFLGFLVYSIVKFKVFNIKVLAAEALVVALWALIGSELFFVTSRTNQVLIIITLAIAIFFGIFLIKSVRREVEQRERLEVLTKELATANDKLKDLDKLKSQFLSFASHDLKSPIALIKQFATLIYDGTYAEAAKVKETAFKIKMTADRAVTLVENFLDIRKIEEGKMEYVFEEKNIVEFVKGITSDFELLAKQKGLSVSFQTSSPEIKVKIDTSKMRQVIQNFLDNSLKYIEAGWIKVAITEEQSTVTIAISDSGIGMDKEILPTLFEQFRRDPSVAKKIQGTGLGLYISKEIVQAHGGEVWAESEGRGKGSTFSVRLKKA